MHIAACIIGGIASIIAVIMLVAVVKYYLAINKGRNKMDSIGAFILGVCSGVSGLVLIAYVATAQATDVCKNQGWDGAACQCRIVLGYDEPPKTKE